MGRQNKTDSSPFLPLCLACPFAHLPFATCPSPYCTAHAHMRQALLEGGTFCPFTLPEWIGLISSLSPDIFPIFPYLVGLCLPLSSLSSHLMSPIPLSIIIFHFSFILHFILTFALCAGMDMWDFLLLPTACLLPMPSVCPFAPTCHLLLLLFPHPALASPPSLPPDPNTPSCLLPYLLVPPTHPSATPCLVPFPATLLLFYLPFCSFFLPQVEQVVGLNVGSTMDWLILRFAVLRFSLSPI